MKKLFVILMVILLVIPFVACKTVNTESTVSDATSKTASTAVSGTSDTSEAEKVLRVGMECAYAPYNWTQTDDSNGAVPISGTNTYAYGYDVMMAKAIAEKIGYKLEIHKIEWTALPTALQAGTIDCVIAGQSITAERLETVDFTTPYYYASIVVLTNKSSTFANAKGMSELSGAKATSQINTVWYDDCIPQIPNVNKQTAMEEVSAMMAALGSGVIDIIVTDQPTAMAACSSNSNFVMLDFTGKEDNFQVSAEEINIGISVKKGNSELLGKINDVLKEYDADKFKELMNSAIAVQPLANS